MPTVGDYTKGESREVDLIKNDVAIFKNLIKERKNRLDLVRELLANAGAREVGATRIEISYTRDREGHIFEVTDNGCGMNFTGRQDLPGRLDRFLGLGLSGIVGDRADEFSWKGLGSKLAYQSRRVEIETRFAGHDRIDVKVNEPWSSLARNLIPKPIVTQYPVEDDTTGTRIRVVGHPPHSSDEPFTFEDIRRFLQHRSFAGFARHREAPPTIILSVLGDTREVAFGFPELSGIEWQDGLVLDEESKRLLVNIVHNGPIAGLVRLRGFLTWDAGAFGLSKAALNTGLIMCSRGIPFFGLNMEDFGSRSIIHANPGSDKVCLLIECDGVYSEMNIARSDLVDSPATDDLKSAVVSLFGRLEGADEYLRFRQIPKGVRMVSSATAVAREKQAIEEDDQNWVVYEGPGKRPVVLVREPKNEFEVNALIWKLEALGGLPFENFQTLAYVGARRGPDLLVNFQEEKDSEPQRAAIIEVENNFYNYVPHGHKPSQYVRVLCWDAPSSGRKLRLTATQKKHKFTVTMGDYQVHVFVLKNVDGIRVVSRRELKGLGVDI